MRVPGQTIFIERTQLSSPGKLAEAAAWAALAVLAAVALVRAVDGSFPASTLVTQLVISVAAQILIGLVILRRAQLRARRDPYAFSETFRRWVLPGLALLGVVGWHFSRLEGEPILPREVVWLPYLYLMVTGTLLLVRAVFTLGVDTLSTMYVLYPQEGRLVEASIYGIIRHPVYSGFVRILMALALDNAGAPALAASALALLFYWSWLHWFEEAELIERFGEGYRAYRARVPALFNLQPRTWPVLWRFLVLGK